MQNIVLLDNVTMGDDVSFDMFKEFGELTMYPRSAKEEIFERAKNASIILTNKVPLSKDTLEKLPKLKYIGVLATGYDIIDLNACKDLGITVCNVPAYSTHAVAQHVFALILELCSAVAIHNTAVQNEEWSSSKDFCFWKKPLVELRNKKMGILGFGETGQAVGEIAHAFGMQVLAYAPRAKKIPAYATDYHNSNSHNTYSGNAHSDSDNASSDSDNITSNSDTMGSENTNAHKPFSFVDLETLFKEADVLSLHAPLNADTKEIINTHNLEKMKNTAILINTARGGLINEADLVKALDEKQIAAVALDVLAKEPPAKNHPLLHRENCIITPHIAWASIEARTRLLTVAAENIAKFLQENPQNKLA